MGDLLALLPEVAPKLVGGGYRTPDRLSLDPTQGR